MIRSLISFLKIVFIKFSSIHIHKIIPYNTLLMVLNESSWQKNRLTLYLYPRDLLQNCNESLIMIYGWRLAGLNKINFHLVSFKSR